MNQRTSASHHASQAPQHQMPQLFHTIPISMYPMNNSGARAYYQQQNHQFPYQGAFFTVVPPQPHTIPARSTGAPSVAGVAGSATK